MKLRFLSKTFLCLMVLALLIPGMLLAQTGKIRGTVMDKETGDPLMGANVAILNTSMGAASDLNGEYIILNVPPGKYDLVVTYMGFKRHTVQGIIVKQGLTAYRDFEMEKEVLEGQEVVIVAERPLIDKSETNEVHVMRGEDLAQMPIRGVQAAIQSMAGVVADGGNVHVRGGRNDEMVYMVDGLSNSNMFGGGSMNSIISNAIEEVQLQTGGFTAEHGGKMSGVTMTSIKTGGAKYNFTGEVISDDFWSLTNDAGSHQILGINELYSYGYNDYVLTVGGPIVPSMDNLRFYIAGQAYNRLSDATWFDGFTMTDTLELRGLWTDWHGTQHRDTMDLFIDTPPGRLPGGGTEGFTLNGNIVYDLKPFRIKIGGIYNNQRWTDQTTDPRGILTVSNRTQKNRSGNYQGSLNITHTVDPTMFYTLAASYSGRYQKWGDAVLGWDRSDWESWGDPNLHSGLLDTSQTYGSYYLPFDPSFTISAYADPDIEPVPSANYGHWEENKITAKFDLTKQFGKTHEVRIGGEYSFGTYRRYNVNARGIMRRLRDVNLNPELYSEWDIWAPLVDARGYDIYGEKVDDDEIYEIILGQPAPVNVNYRNGPVKPKYGGAYLQDRIELRDLIINAGLRFDYITNGHPGLTDLAALEMGPGNVVADSNWTDPRVYTYVSPRLGFSFPVTDQAVFHAQFGKYIQAPNINQTWAGRSYEAWTDLLYGGVYAAALHNPNLKPEKTTSYEFGFQMQFGANASLDLTAFYKDTRDLLTLRQIVPTITDYRTPMFYMNGDFGTIKGFTATFNLRRTSRIQANLNYTYSNAEGTGSASGSHFDIAWQEEDPHFPRLIFPLDYDQRHKGTAVVDFRTLAEDGPEIMGFRPIANVGLNMKFDFHSGSPYTRIPIGDAFSSVYGFNAPKPTEAPNQSTLPWFYQLDAKLDKTFMVGPVKLNVYLWAINVLGLKSIVGGEFRQTGRPDTDGYLETDAGKAKMLALGEQGEDWAKWYQAILTSCGTRGWQAPRQIRFGLKFEI